MATIGFLGIKANLEINGNKQQFEVADTETNGTLALATLRVPTDENPTSTQMVAKTILEDGFFLEYKAFLDSTQNTTTFGLTKKGIADPIFIVKDDQTIEFKYTATGSISGGGGGGGGGVAQSYVDAQDTTIYNNSKKYTDEQTKSLITQANLTTALTSYYTKTNIDQKLEEYLIKTDLTETLADYAKKSDMTQENATSTLSSNVTIQHDSNNTSQFNLLCGVLKNIFSQGSTIISYTTPSGKILNTQVIGTTEGIETNIGADTSWIQVIDKTSSRKILLGLPLQYEFVGTMNGYQLQANDLVHKGYVDSLASNSSSVPIGSALLIAKPTFNGWSGSFLYEKLNTYMGYGQWRVTGETISQSEFPTAYTLFGGTGGTASIPSFTAPNSLMMYIFRVG